MRAGEGRRPPRIAFDEDGAAILEFALALPILLALVAGTVELGRAVLVRQAMIEAVRGGARYLARVPDPSCVPACTQGARLAVAATLDQILGASGLPASAVNVSFGWDQGSGIVTLRAEARLGVDLLRAIGFGPVLTLTAAHRERRIGE